MTQIKNKYMKKKGRKNGFKKRNTKKVSRWN